jgi:type VI secretion system protein ImpL
MMKDKKAIWSFLGLLVLFSLLHTLFAWGLNILVFTPWWLGTIVVISILLLSSLFSFLIVRSLFGVKDPEKEALKLQASFYRAYFKKSFDALWRIQAKTSTNPYHTPWYLYINENYDDDRVLIEQMGYEPIELEDKYNNENAPISFWLNESSVLVCIHQTSPIEKLNQATDLLTKHLLKKRPRQAVNGMIVGVSIRELLSNDSSAISNKGKKDRNLIRHFNQSFGLNLPLYSIFTHMSELRDFCEIFSTLDERERDQAFGALVPDKSQLEFNKTWFDESFDELQKNISDSLSNALKSQLNTDYRDAIVAGTFQFAILKSNIENYFNSLFIDHQFEGKALYFRGYFFANAGGEARPIDPLTMMQASDLGYEQLSRQELVKKNLSLFGKSLMRSILVKESHIVGVQSRRELTYRFTRVFVTGGLLMFFIGVLWVFKSSFDFQQEIDQKAIVQLDRYEENLASNGLIGDDLSSPIFSLSEIRDIYLLYRVEKPWFLFSWLPDSSIQVEVDKAYFKELEEVLLVRMRDYLLKDLFVYNKLGDKVKTLELFNLQQILYNPVRDNSEVLVEYYVSALKEEGEGDTVILARFRELAHDLLATSAVPQQDNQELVDLVKTSLSTEDVSDLLYQHILQEERYSQRIDLREKLGQSYLKVFKFKADFNQYLVPFLFTRDGFQELMASTGFELADDAIKGYEGVMGRVSEAELSRINRQLRQHYIDDYISFWQNFISNIEWVRTESWADTKQQLALASDPIFSPLVRLYSLIASNTNISEVFKPKVPVKDEKATEVVAENKPSEMVTKIANEIELPFVSYQKLTQLDDAGQSRLDIALTQMTNTLNWIKQSDESQSREQFFLEQVAKLDTISPIAQMDTLSHSYSDPILPNMLQGIANLFNQLALVDIRSLINTDWTVVSRFYNAKLSNKYPYKKSAKTDVSLKDFQDFYGPEGTVAGFVKAYESYFTKSSDGRTMMRSFLVDRHLILNLGYEAAIDKVNKVRAVFFLKNAVQVPFLVKAQSMTPTLTEFTIRDDGLLFSYRNGPTIWQNLTWPMLDNQSFNLDLQIKNVDGIVNRQRFEGFWNWFRLADALKGSLITGTQDVSLLYSDKDNQVRFILRVENGVNPFVANYFAGTQIPLTL